MASVAPSRGSRITSESPTMPSKPSRRFLLSDAVVVISATAVGCTLLRAVELHDVMGLLTDRNTVFEPGMRKIVLIQSLLSYPLPFLAAWTPALLFLGLR